MSGRRPPGPDKQRPPLGPGQESVWDYPRPPAVVRDLRPVRVLAEGQEIANTSRAVRVLETASPPTYYIPAFTIAWEELVQTAHSSYCEWKGRASYFALANDPRQRAVAWIYANPSESFADLHEHVSFYPGRVDCFVDGERVEAQPGEFYGGWVTKRIVGPFKGEPGTGHW